MDSEKKTSLAFAAIDKSIIKEIPKQIEGESRGKDYITWGEDNLYPEFLFGLYHDNNRNLFFYY